MEDYLTIRLPILTKDNWPIWKWRIDIINRELESKIYNLISINIDESILPIVRHCSNSQIMLKTLSEYFDDNNVTTTVAHSQTYPKRLEHSLDNQGDTENSMKRKFVPLFENLYDEISNLLSKYEKNDSFKESIRKIYKTGDDFYKSLLDFSIKEMKCSVSNINNASKNFNNNRNDFSSFDPPPLSMEISRNSKGTTSFSTDINNKEDFDRTLDEIVVTFQPKSLDFNVNSSKTPKNDQWKEVSFDQTNDLCLWPRLLLLEPEFLRNMDKFYSADHSEIFWLFDNQGKVYKYGHLNQYVEDIDRLDHPEEIKGLSHVECLVRGQRGNWWLFITENNHLYGMGDNMQGQLGLGNKDRQSTPALIAKNISKVTCGFTHTLAIDCEGKLYSCGSNLSPGETSDSLKLSPVKFFSKSPVDDIACFQNVSLVLIDKNTIFFWGKMGQNHLFPPTRIKLSYLVRSMVGGKSQLVIFTKENDETAARVCFIDDEMNISTIKKLTIPKFKNCYNSYKSNNFVFVDYSNKCSFWMQEEEKLIQTSFKSVSDCLAFYDKSITPIITQIPKRLIAHLYNDNIPIFNNPMFADIIFKPNLKPVYVNRSKLSIRSDVLEKLMEKKWIKKYPIELDYKYSVFYLYIKFVYHQTIEELEQYNEAKRLLNDLFALSAEFDDIEFMEYLSTLEV